MVGGMLGDNMGVVVGGRVGGGVGDVTGGVVGGVEVAGIHPVCSAFTMSPASHSSHLLLKPPREYVPGAHFTHLNFPSAS